MLETRKPTGLSGPKTGKRKLVTRKADGKLTFFVNLGRVLARKADAFGYPFQLTQLSLPISGLLIDQARPGQARLDYRLRRSLQTIGAYRKCMH